MSGVLLISGVVLVAAALFTIIGAFGGLVPEEEGVGRSLAVMSALTDAPDELKRTLETPFAERVLDPVLNALHRLGARITPSDSRERIRAKLDAAGNPPGWTVERIANMKGVGLFLGFGIGGVACFALGTSLMWSVLVVVAASLAGFAAPNFWLHQQAYDRSELMQGELPDAIDLLTISVESGLGFDAAVAQVAKNTHGPLAGEFARVLQEMQIGKTRSDSLRSLADRCELPDLKSFVGAMVQADAFGIPIGNVLRVQSSEIRVKRRQWAEEAAQKVPVKILVPLIFCILPCLFIAVLGPAAISIMQNFKGM